VRHRRGALLAATERLGQFSDLRALGAPDLQGNLLDGGAEDGQRGEDLGVAVALHDLGRGGSRFQTQLLAGNCFDLGIYVRVGADGAGDLAYGGNFFRVRQPIQVPLHLEGPHRELVPQHRRFRMYPVRPSHHDGVPVLQSHLAEQEGQFPGISLDEIQRLPQL
jgi:hypothetical protein